MRKFLYSLAFFYLLSEAVEYYLNHFTMAAIPEDAAWYSVDAIQQGILITVIVSGLMIVWPTIRFIIRRMHLSLRGLRWMDNSRFLNIIALSEADGANPLLGKKQFVVRNFVYRGQNTSDQTMTDISGSIRFDKTKETFPLLLDYQPTDQVNTVTPHAEFIISAELPLIPVKQFLKHYNSFRLTFSYNGHTYTESFPIEKIVLLVRKRTKELKRQR